MGVDKIDDCVVVPNHHDWSEKLKWSRTWSTQIAHGVTGTEDRSNGRRGAYQKIQFRVLAISVEQRARLTARVLEALKTGRACAPFWGRQNITTGIPPIHDVPFGEGFVLESPYWPWQSGDYVFFTVARPMSFENRSLQLDVGGAEVAPYAEDTGFYSTGSPLTTANPIDVTAILEPPPQAVLQCGRVSTGEVIYTLPGFEPGMTVRVILWFAQIDPLVNQTLNRQRMDIRISGVTAELITNYEILDYADGPHDKATGLSVALNPDTNGVINVTLTPSVGGNNTTLVNAIEVHQLTWEMAQLTAGTDATQIAFTGKLLRGVWPVGTTVYPVLFGKLSVDNLEALTTRHGACLLTLEEPLGTGEVAQPGCDEVCVPDPELIDPTRHFTYLPFNATHPPKWPMLVFDPIYDDTGHYDGSHGTFLGHGGTVRPSAAEVAFMLEKAKQNFSESLKVPGVAGGSIIYWRLQEGSGARYQSGYAMEGTWTKTLYGTFLMIQLVYAA